MATEDRARGARGEQGERTRARLMEAARTVFRERGFSPARVDDITEAAGTSHGGFYLYFANKADVLEALAVETAEEMYALAESLDGITAGPDGAQRLREWVSRFVDAYEHHAPVVGAWIAADSEDTRFDALGREVLAKFAGRIAAAIEHATGPAGSDIDPATAAVALVAMLERVCYFWLVRGGPFERDTVIATMTKVWDATIFGHR